MKRAFIAAVCLFALAIGGWVAFTTFYKVVVKTDYHPHKSAVDLELQDDQVSELKAVFDPALVDKRLLDEWEVNSSGATLKLDCPDMKVDRNPELDQLYPGYIDAIAAAKKSRYDLLPSANLVDGAAKQFDDGLYAAIDVAVFSGKVPGMTSPVAVVEKVAAALPSKSEAVAFLAAALELAGKQIEIDPSLENSKSKWRSDFDQNELLSKPIGFYTWNEDLKWIWKFSKFLQHEFVDDKIPNELAAVIRGDAALLSDYQALMRHANNMTNPANCLSLDQLQSGKTLHDLSQLHNVPAEAVAFFSASSSKENELFERLFANGLPQGVNLMSVLIQKVLSGDVDLQPREGAGWYDHQVSALETLLLPSKGAENDKLLFTAKYKKRLLEAFKSMITKRRETHARQLAALKEASAPRLPTVVRPRLRVEPCASFYLRTARAYRFVENYLESSLGRESLNQLVGLRETSDRGMPLGNELANIRNRFYGLYLIVCDDIGMQPEFADGETVDVDACYDLAQLWLDEIESNIDLGLDTRVSVPVGHNSMENTTRLWSTIGVRLAKLDVSYINPPRIRPQGELEWQDVKSRSVKRSSYVIAVDEFAELTIKGARTFNRDEFRAFCDQHKSREAIVAAAGE